MQMGIMCVKHNYDDTKYSYSGVECGGIMANSIIIITLIYNYIQVFSF